MVAQSAYNKLKPVQGAFIDPEELKSMIFELSNRVLGVPARQGSAHGRKYNPQDEADAIRSVADYRCHHYDTVYTLWDHYKEFDDILIVTHSQKGAGSDLYETEPENYKKHGLRTWVTPEIEAHLLKWMRRQDREHHWLSSGLVCCELYKKYDVVVSTRAMLKYLNSLGWQWSSTVTSKATRAERNLKEDPTVRFRAMQFILQKSIAFMLVCLGTHIRIGLDESYYHVNDSSGMSMQENSELPKDNDGKIIYPKDLKGAGKFCLLFAIAHSGPGFEASPLVVLDDKEGWKARYLEMAGKEWEEGLPRMYAMPAEKWDGKDAAVADDEYNSLWMFHTGTGLATKGKGKDKKVDEHVSKIIEGKNWLPWMERKVMATFHKKYPGKNVIAQKDNVGYSLKLKEGDLRPKEMNRTQLIAVIRNNCFPTMTRGAAAQGTLLLANKAAVFGLRVRRKKGKTSYIDDRSPNGQTPKEWKTYEEIGKTLAKGGPDKTELRAFLCYYCAEYLPGTVDYKLQTIVGQYGLILLTPPHMSYKYNRAKNTSGPK
jgi:hypothetical protein